MKAFIAICLFAVAAAEPEADPAVLYSAAGYAAPYAYSYAPYAYSGYYPYAAYAGAYAGYASPYYYGARLLKREAEAEAEADPAVLYAGAYGFPYAARAYSYGFPYAYAPYAYSAPAAIPAVPGAYAAAGRYVANSAGVVHVAKREAEAEADPAVLYAGAYGFPYAARAYSYGFPYTYAPYAYSAPAAIPAVPGAYAAAGRYVANSAGVVHVAKREAEAEADPALLYSSAFTYPYTTYGAYAYGAYPYASTYAYTAPYAYGAYGAFPYGRYFY